MATKKKRPVRRLAKKTAGRRRVAAKRVAPKTYSTAQRLATGRQGTRQKGASKNTSVGRKKREVEEARYPIDAEKEPAVEQLPKTVHPTTKKRGADPHVPSRRKRKRSSNSNEQKLEQGLEESMAGSDPVSVTQPTMPIAEKPKGRS